VDKEKSSLAFEWHEGFSKDSYNLRGGMR